MNNFKLSHHYSRSTAFFGVSTTMSLHELNLACAYIQLLRFNLPCMKGVEDDVDEEAGMLVLVDLYAVRPLTEKCKTDDELDFYANWNNYCGGKLKEYLPLLNAKYATADAYKALLKNMIKECNDSIERSLAHNLDYGDHNYIEDVKANIPRLNVLINGGQVEKEWGWKNLAGEDCSGKRFVMNDNAPDYADF